jgi:hypothetical protein
MEKEAAFALKLLVMMQGMENGVMGNYDPIQSELAENVTLRAVRGLPLAPVRLFHRVPVSMARW